MGWGIKGLLGKGGIGGAAKAVGGSIVNVKNAWSVNKDATDARGFDSFASARSMIPQSWLAKQIRPVGTIIIFLPVPMAFTPYYYVVDRGFETLATAPDYYWYILFTIITYWFGGQMHKYQINHAENKQRAADSKEVGAVAGATPVSLRPMITKNPAVERFFADAQRDK